MQAEASEQTAIFRRAKEFFASIPHGAELGLELVAFQDRVATARLPYRPELVGNPWNGMLHGGVLITMIDQVSGTAAACSLPAPEMVATLDLRIDYLRSARAGAALTARAECYRITPSIAFVRCEAYHEGDDMPLATAVSSFMRTGSGT